MKNVFLDTNVVIDFLADRRPFSIAAANIFNLSANGKINLYVSAVSFNNIYYIIRQSQSHADTIRLLHGLSELTEIADVTKAVIMASLKGNFKDFEDAIQYNCALGLNNIDVIVTRDSKDFRKSTLPVLSPEEALAVF